MRVLFDQNTPRPLAQYLTAHQVRRAIDLGWDKLRNGDLLKAAEDAGFDVLLSGDKKMRYEQNMAGRRIAIVCLSANNWPIVKNHITAISHAVEQAVPGTLIFVECGTFLARRFDVERA